ncbi:MAG TPA: hypothetical protein VG498_23285 [Terriglobales bacterium]|nr:hypothetical protein [Terriglobales bacterium]
MSRRKNKRHFIALAMFAMGNDVQGNSFRDPVCTLDVSAAGVRIGKFHRKLEVGDELTLQYKSYKIRCRVAWIGASATPAEGQVGLRAVDSVRRICELDELLSAPYVDTWTPRGGAPSKVPVPAAANSGG